MNAPIIIIGMHRSGTTLVARLLEAYGVYWGSVTDNYNEAVSFQVINDLLMGVDGCAWDDGYCLDHSFSLPLRLQRGQEMVKAIVDEQFMDLYFRNHQNREPRDTGELGVWGFKDPRNTYTLPVWLHRFPQAKVIHVIRNGIDVARSLHKRETTRPEGQAHPHYSERCQTLEGCLELWTHYVRRAERHPPESSMLFRLYYEDLLENPRGQMAKLAEYLELDEKALDQTVFNQLDVSRRFAFLAASDVVDQRFAEKAQTHELMTELYQDRLSRTLSDN
ncbi:MAG: sulfotransferase [Desulfobulbaceae bacterium]|nr:MAG: sulfotransferase [Desulfobulbaceae bacterium]